MSIIDYLIYARNNTQNMYNHYWGYYCCGMAEINYNDYDETLDEFCHYQEVDPEHFHVIDTPTYEATGRALPQVIYDHGENSYYYYR